MQELVELVENEPRVSHRVVAQSTNNQVVSIQNLINKNINDFEEFGTLHFKNEGVINNGKGDQPKTYYLNEPQSTFLMTLLSIGALSFKMTGINVSCFLLGGILCKK